MNNQSQTQPQTDVSIMDLLRESTAEMHNAAEANEFQHLLGSGRVSKEDLNRYLQQLYLIHKHLNALLDKNKNEHKALAHVVKDYHLDLGCISKDIKFFGSDPEAATANNSAKKLIAAMDEAASRAPQVLLGYLYVLEGSTNGAKFLAKNLKAGLGLPESEGASYFDRYGESQRQRWMAFKSDMNELEFSEPERQEMVSKAREIFNTFGGIGDELLGKG